MAPSTSPTDRAHYRELVAQVAEKARAILPAAVNGRLEGAVKLVLFGDVEPQDDGTIRVGSSDPTRYYVLTGQSCECKDFPKAPSGWCRHRIAAGIDKRVRELLAASHPPTLATAPPLPEAPASVNCHITVEGRQVQVTLRDTDETRLLQRLAALLKQSPAPAPPERQQGWCALHQVPMTQTTKDGRSWWSHRTAQGWCKGKLCRESGK
jgi:hypothetical protein